MTVREFSLSICPAFLRHLAKSRSESVLTHAAVLLAARPAEFAKDRRIPVISGWAELAHSGGLMTYGPSSSKFFRRLAACVKKIAAGAKPSEIPIEQPTTFELVINLKTARSIGLTIPPTLLARADEVIE
jgi:putative ABC transport system substrate-binding protein